MNLFCSRRGWLVFFSLLLLPCSHIGLGLTGRPFLVFGQRRALLYEVVFGLAVVASLRHRRLGTLRGQVVGEIPAIETSKRERRMNTLKSNSEDPAILIQFYYWSNAELQVNFT